ncbi:uncharacterized protein N7479_001401 [Penicillium vulpinum]|uniref:uncharacterized protein n=1 Tax=Penicillium vulpinum TaxID=29845 RepID=UPI0025498026|nr:uncharacterized protein N7479_001401 [Penicillium vulpinum]KAJ5971483.1 hypothetical protein N7479_001401 [Penicillium vulpinum]
MSDKTPFLISDRIYSLMPETRRQALRSYQERSMGMGISSKVFQGSQVSLQPTASEFLNAKIASLQEEKA